MQNIPATEPLVLTDDQIVPERRTKSRHRSRPAKATQTATNPRETLWNCEDLILGLDEQVIETHAHAYMLQAQIRSASTFEAFLRARLLGGSHGSTESIARTQRNSEARTQNSMKLQWHAQSIVERLSFRLPAAVMPRLRLSSGGTPDH